MTVNAHTSQARKSWRSYAAFLLAAAGSSVGLGNVWRFPSELGVHGGTYFYVYTVKVLNYSNFNLDNEGRYITQNTSSY